MGPCITCLLGLRRLPSCCCCTSGRPPANMPHPVTPPPLLPNAYCMPLRCAGEKQAYTLLQQLNAIRNDKARKRREQSGRRHAEYDKKLASQEAWRSTWVWAGRPRAVEQPACAPAAACRGRLRCARATVPAAHACDNGSPGPALHCAARPIWVTAARTLDARCRLTASPSPSPPALLPGLPGSTRRSARSATATRARPRSARLWAASTAAVASAGRRLPPMRGDRGDGVSADPGSGRSRPVSASCEGPPVPCPCCPARNGGKRRAGQ